MCERRWRREAIQSRRERHSLYQEIDETNDVVSVFALFPAPWLLVATTALGSDLCADTVAAGPAPVHTRTASPARCAVWQPGHDLQPIAGWSYPVAPGFCRSAEG
jgi:hypothetical protein